MVLSKSFTWHTILYVKTNKNKLWRDDVCSNSIPRNQRRSKWLLELVRSGGDGRNGSSKSAILFSSVVGLSSCPLQICSEHGYVWVHTSDTLYWCRRDLMGTTWLRWGFGGYGIELIWEQELAMWFLIFCHRTVVINVLWYQNDNLLYLQATSRQWSMLFG